MSSQPEIENEAPTDAALAETVEAEDAPATTPPESAKHEVGDQHLRGLVEALVFASDRPLKSGEIGKLASAPTRQITKVLEELREEYKGRGVQLDEIAGGWVFRTSALYAPFVRDMTGQRPVRLSRAQVETLAIVAYRQPVTRPEVDDIRGVDCGAVLKLLLERDLVRILGKKDEPGRPILYGTSAAFLELFGLKSLKDLPTLREFTELNEDSRRTVEKELEEDLEARGGGVDELVGALQDEHSPASMEDPSPDVRDDRQTMMSPPLVDDEDTQAVEKAAEPEEQKVSKLYDPADELEFPDDADEDDDDDDDDDDEEDEDE